jgi:hypothetical protein
MSQLELADEFQRARKIKAASDVTNRIVKLRQQIAQCASALRLCTSAQLRAKLARQLSYTKKELEELNRQA